MKNTLSLVRILYDPTRIDRQVKVVNCWLLFPLMRPLRLVIMEVIRGSFCEAGPGLNSLTSSAIPESKDWFKLKCIPKFFYILSSTTLRFLFYVLVLWTMSEMVKYKGSVLLKRRKSGPVYHHLWHSPWYQDKIFLSFSKYFNQWQYSTEGPEMPERNQMVSTLASIMGYRLAIINPEAANRKVSLIE